MNEKPTIAVFKFTGCAGCQLEFLHLEDVFLDLLALLDISYWVMVKRDNIEGPGISALSKEESQLLKK
ncbi:MAG: hypothetical protein V1726_04915 [Methanobacteriota archaeon]